MWCSTNPLVRVLGGFTVTKHVTGETAGYVADSTFTVKYTCDDGTDRDADVDRRQHLGR